MSTEEQIEGNKLIAEFMGLEYFINHEGTHFVFKEDKTLPYLIPCYHSSWDWLMPVIQKLKDIVHEQDNFLKMAGRFMGVQEASLQFEINTLWLVVVQFIKWYNANKQ